MKSDIEPGRIIRQPDGARILLSGGSTINQGFVVKRVEMRQYVGLASLINRALIELQRQ